MSIRRKNTVHDLTSLRLHPDGSRVQNINRSKKEGGPAAASTRLAKYTTRDALGRWIAYDAGGLAAVKQRVRISKSKSRITGSSDEDADHDEIKGTLSSGAGPSQVPTREGSSAEAMDGENIEDAGGYTKDNRAKKRMKFYHDFSFLDEPQQLVPPASVNDPTGSEPILGDIPAAGTTFPVPSSELLKGIHYFASHFYAEKGWLYNAPALAKKRRGERKLKKLRKAVAAATTIGRIAGSQESSDDITQGGGVDALENDELSDGEHVKGAAKKKSKELPRRDMYRAFDGSALMALGMLVQEYIAQTTDAMPTEEWLVQMAELENAEGNKRRSRKRRGNLKGSRSEANNSNARPSKSNRDVADSESDRDGKDLGLSTGSSSGDDAETTAESEDD